MFKKGFDYYFDIAYILLLFLCFLFFMPYLVLALLIHLKIDNFICLLAQFSRRDFKGPRETNAGVKVLGNGKEIETVKTKFIGPSL